MTQCYLGTPSFLKKSYKKMTNKVVYSVMKHYSIITNPSTGKQKSIVFHILYLTNQILKYLKWIFLGRITRVTLPSTWRQKLETGKYLTFLRFFFHYTLKMFSKAVHRILIRRENMVILVCSMYIRDAAPPLPSLQRVLQSPKKLLTRGSLTPPGPLFLGTFDL